ncbi:MULTISPECIES: hypothetical protein [Streptomyces]|uniref:Secreted protein n=1 Tax=Streptomyces viridochromogenes TaxID=1938 RepID=A0A0L8J8J4_STRVR|nr:MULTISPECIES: hypothetical protein [Streptomyces]KOG09844.1 hypothetical protein ADK34_36480 [Streptomyces viridochromogenes]
MPWATALSALAAAIGLFFSATVASSSVDATRRQLDQDERQQAGRVGYWTESVDDLTDTIIIVNRSLDPVTNVELWWYAPDDSNIDPAEHEDVFMAFATIPPCTRMVFDHRAVDEYLLTNFGIAQGGAPLRAIQFIDSDGRQWLRNEAGLRAAENEREDGQDIGDPPARQEPAEHCDK